jgi:NAD+ synthase (glutamine-hydrolysing)
MRVALGQFNAVVGDLDGNTARMRHVYEKAIGLGADLLVFPELAVCGYPPEDLLLKRHFLRDNRAAVEKLAADCPGMTLIAGFAGGFDSGCCNCAGVLEKGRVKAVYHKNLLPNYGVFDERRYFTAGTEPLVVDVAGLKVAVTVCADIWEVRWMKNLLEGRGRPQVVVNISASPFYVGKFEKRQAVVSECAKTFKSAVCYCNLVGGQDELVFDGRSMIADASGGIIATARAFGEDTLSADITPARGSVLVSPAGPAARQPAGTIEEMYQALVLGTRDYTWKNGFEKVLVGLSGGIDSSVVAAVAAEALGAKNVTGITMPSKFNSPQTIADARRLARNLGINFLTIPIGPVLGRFDEVLGAAADWDGSGIAHENLQARIRGCMLMSLSNRCGSLVLTTGNKSETAVGYTTLYGDTAGGFAVIKDVPKTAVYRLAEHINAAAGRDVIPPEVLARPPSAELKPGQKDTDSLPDYDVLDRILTGYIEQDKSLRELAGEGLPERTVLDVVRMVDRNEYKRRQSPPGVKLTPKAFGRDRRLPITNRYVEKP